VFDMPLAQDPAGLTATQLSIDPTDPGTDVVERRVRKITSQTQLGTSITHSLDAQRSLTARAYTGTRDNLQFQANNQWVGLDRNYYGVGVQYNAQSTVGDTPIQWVAGYEYDRSSEHRQGGVAVNGEKGTTAPLLNRDENNTATNSDLFFQGTALLSDRWSLTGGLRHSTVSFKSKDYFINEASTPPNLDGSGTVKYSATNPVIGLTWHAADTLNLYANLGKGFETPTLAEAAYLPSGTDVLTTFNPTLKAARSRHFEVGTKWAPTPQSRVDLAIFRINTNDEIVVLSSQSGRTAFQNAPSTQRTGFELAARSLLGPQWRATLSATAIQAKFTQGFQSTSTSNMNVVTPSNVASGNRLPGIPQHFVFGELLWAQQGYAGAAPKAGPGLQAGVELVDAGKMEVNDRNSPSRATGYTVLNLKASQAWRVGKGSLTAYARIDNVTDRQYIGSVIVNQTSTPGQFYEPAPGRNWTVGLRLNVPL
jgi:iron complex outermembrane recepter protein